MKKSAFTLAEVLITLVIIGVIAALTVPTLIQNTQKQEYVSALKKAYSTLSQATQSIILEEGAISSWAVSQENIYDLYRKHLNNAKECSNTSTGCFNTKYLRLNGNALGNWDEWNDIRKLVLADGMSLAFGLTGNCLNSSEYRPFCIWIVVDVNGNKQPNKMGRDVFQFYLMENGLYPAGCDNNYMNCDINNKSDEGGHGTDCTCKVLSEGAMNY